MRKKLILAVAISLVLISGGFASAQADCSLCNLSPCNWHWPSCACNVGSHDADKAH